MAMRDASPAAVRAWVLMLGTLVGWVCVGLGIMAGEAWGAWWTAAAGLACVVFAAVIAYSWPRDKEECTCACHRMK